MDSDYEPVPPLPLIDVIKRMKTLYSYAGSKAALTDAFILALSDDREDVRVRFVKRRKGKA